MLSGNLKNTTDMIIIKLKKTKDFTQIPNKPLRDKRLSAEARGVLCFLLSHDSSFDITRENLYEEFSIKKEKLLKITDNLKAFGYLQVNRKYNNQGLMSGWEWTVFESSQETDFRVCERTGKHTFRTVGKTHLSNGRENRPFGDTEKPPVQTVGKTARSDGRENTPFGRTEKPTVGKTARSLKEEKINKEEYILSESKEESLNPVLREKREGEKLQVESTSHEQKQENPPTPEIKKGVKANFGASPALRLYKKFFPNSSLDTQQLEFLLEKFPAGTNEKVLEETFKEWAAAKWNPLSFGSIHDRYRKNLTRLEKEAQDAKDLKTLDGIETVEELDFETPELTYELDDETAIKPLSPEDLQKQIEFFADLKEKNLLENWAWAKDQFTPQDWDAIQQALENKNIEGEKQYATTTI